MTEYLSKKAVLEWLDEKIISVRGLAIVFRNQGDELGERDCRHDADALSIIKSKIQSGEFDADESEGTWKATAEVLGRENAQMNSEIKRLRAAAIKLHETINSFWQGDCDKADVVAAQSKLCDVLSTTTEPTDPYTIRRDEYGHAVAIERDGFTVLHLQPGTERNEQEVEGIVALLNMNAAKVERVREYYRKLEELRNRTKYRDAAIEYEQRITDICNVLNFLGITIPGINATETKQDDDLLGDWTDERCPKCGANLLGNKVGDKWCSLVGCEYDINAPKGEGNDA